MADLAFASNGPADPAQLLGGALVQLGNVVECFGNGAGNTGFAFGQARPEVAAAEGAERAEDGRYIDAIEVIVG